MIRSLVVKALENWPETRNSDRKLIMAVWYLQDPNWHKDPKRFILEKAILPGSITRHARKLREEGRYLGTDEVTEARYQKHVEVSGGNLNALG